MEGPEFETTRRFVNTPSGRISYVERGAGPAALFVHGVMLNGYGPFEAAVDLRGSKGQHGFDHLTLWSDGDQMALYKVLPAFYRSGWRSCHTELGHWGGEAVFTRRGMPVFISVDISYWGKRRLRVFPRWYPRTKERECLPDEDLGLFGL